MNVDPLGTSEDSIWSKIGKFLGGLILVAFGAAIVFTTIGLALFSPAATVVSEFGLTMGFYGAGLIGSVFNDQIYRDMEAIHWNPYNQDADAVVNSGIMSFYKGVPVIRSNGDRSGTFGIMLLTRGRPANTVKHEFGHIPQLMLLGIVRFGLTVGIPSYKEWGVGTYWKYYEAPWEAMADMFGGVQNTDYPLTASEKARAIKYLIASYFLGPLVLPFYHSF